MTILERLAGGLAIEEPVAVVVAHYDDETVSMGGVLHLFHCLTLIHVTDGVHPNQAMRMKAGALTKKQYLRLRRREIAAALQAGDWHPVRHLVYDVPDQAVARRLSAVQDRLARDLVGQAAVFTHPYEGGHPDHDAISCAVQRVGIYPRYEFASYHLGPSGRVVGQFWPDPRYPSVSLTIGDAALVRKRAAADVYRATQGGVIDWFDLTQEAYRAAPTYDFTQPPPPGRCLYERKGLMAQADWARLVAA